MAKPAIEGLWRVPAYLPSVYPPPDAATIRAEEKLLGVRLPRAYLAALRVQNGGYLRRTLPGVAHRMIWGIGDGHGSLDPAGWQAAVDANEDAGMWTPRSPELLVPFDGDGHFCLCLDYRKRGARAEPEVSLVDLELEREQRLATSFDAFLARLVIPSDEAVMGVATRLSVAAAAAALGQALRRPPLDRCQEAYEAFAYNLGTRNEPLWAAIAPNRVPRGYWPKEYKRPRGHIRLPGTALRWPELPGCKLVVTASPDVADRVAAACTKAFGAPPAVLAQ